MGRAEQQGALPRLLLCAPSSGGGKTTVACALLQALVEAGKEPVAFKCGPDYIDPMFHSEVIGARSRNLDLFLLGEDSVRSLLWRNGRTGGVAVIEGAMGYYDGIAMSSEASAYDLARRTGTPAVLVLDARGRALSAAAVVKGMAAFRPDANIRGVILNRISPMLYPRLKASIEAETGIRVYGFLPQRTDCAIESRHLGLVTAGEVEQLKEKLSLLAELARKHIDLPGLLELACGAAPLELGEAETVRTAASGPRIAVARDRAFCFYYEDGLDRLRELGAELVEFSPMGDRALPEDIHGLYLGGGYPELYARELSENTAMRESVRDAIAGGLPTVAECGGFLYLHDTLEDEKGESWPMVGTVCAPAERTGRLGRFGYITMTAREDGLLCRRGEQLNAHEFHYWESGAAGSAFRAQKPQSDRGWDCAWHTPTMYAGFPHFHFGNQSGAAERFVSACARFQKERQP